MPSAKASKAELKLFSRFEEEPRPIPKICILDTNVVLGAGPNSVPDCRKIMDCINDKTIDKIVVSREIIDEYQHKLEIYNGQSLAEKTLANLLIAGRIEWRFITKNSKSEYDYSQFPDDPRLSDFDGSDRKFVAVANAGDHVPILQSMDWKWWRWAAPLHDNGIEVLFTNPDVAKRRCSKKNNDCDKNCSNCQKQKR